MIDSNFDRSRHDAERRPGTVIVTAEVLDTVAVINLTENSTPPQRSAIFLWLTIALVKLAAIPSS